ncbi:MULTISPECIES: M14 family metallopeptidase [Cytobacillus]|uniref:LysM peptidoglycan-binding domain-containing protein n=1 Tax=Cytobacillus stercorigallinarum TaxID=2762240 RepID=A0ABR8QK32_9BACI|nr:M14 family metallopeptidase [Cytobacillus stercorigallinarum]MBD7935866.1 LysM peptidoglycan-binding domain-containing protein [Cytobacillus stercorigallinarum]
MKIKVRSGDSLWYYSQLFMVPINLVIDSNPQVDPSSLQIGQSIQIPGFHTSTIKLQKGDSLWRIASKNNLPVDALLLLNQQLQPQNLQVNQTVLVPKRVIMPLMDRKKSYSFKTLQDDLKQLKEVYPFIKINEIGYSVAGKPLYEIRIGTGEKQVHYNASFHANEWITTPVLMSLINAYLLSMTNAKPLRGMETLPFYSRVELSIVPMVNPDGVDLVLGGPPEAYKEEILAINEQKDDFSLWKANIRGVDLNKQYPANWEYEKERKPDVPSSRDFPGYEPLSEPEATAMANLVENNNFSLLLAFHTQGEEFYWGFEGLEPPDSKVIADEFERVSGYRSVQYVDSFAGFRDWFIQEYRRPGFTMELGKGVNPLPLSQYEDMYEEMLGVFLASLYL